MTERGHSVLEVSTRLGVSDMSFYVWLTASSISAGAGLAVPAEDAKALADAVLRLYGMTPAEREKFGLNGRCYY